VISSSEIHFCPRCGQPIHHLLKFGKERPVCLSCGWIYFSDPKVAVVAVIVQDGKLLLARRVNEPHRGKWTLPGGFMDAMEDPIDAVQRECREETGLDVQVGDFLELISGREHEHGSDLLLVYNAAVKGGTLTPGDDADVAEFFAPSDLPEIAFNSTQKLIDRLFPQ
jgi:8-oxo-dGTP diphosphatase